MHTPAEHPDGVQAAVHDVAEHARSLARLEVELAKVEVREKVSALSGGAVLLAVGGVVALYALGFLLATVAAALALVLPTWLALLLVGITLLAVAGGLLALGRSQLQRGVPLAPERAIEEAKLTGAALSGADRG
jgi:Putative Actinobacterial Holin-X, holin superfamily III